MNIYLSTPKVFPLKSLNVFSLVNITADNMSPLAAGIPLTVILCCVSGTEHCSTLTAICVYMHVNDSVMIVDQLVVGQLLVEICMDS